MARSLCALNLPLELHGSDTRGQSAATHPTDRLLRLQTFLQACRAKVFWGGGSCRSSGARDRTHATAATRATAVATRDP